MDCNLGRRDVFGSHQALGHFADPHQLGAAHRDGRLRSHHLPAGASIQPAPQSQPGHAGVDALPGAIGAGSQDALGSPRQRPCGERQLHAPPRVEGQHRAGRQGPRTRERDDGLGEVIDGRVAPEDISVRLETLEHQARFAREAGYDQVAESLERAAEMTRIPDEEILELYEALRPGRSTYYSLLSMSQRIASMYGAELTGAYIREAADAYRDTGLLKMDED